MNPNQNQGSGLKKVWYVILAIVVILVIILAVSGKDAPVDEGTDMNTNTSGNTTGGNTTGNNSGTTGNNGNGGIAGNVATVPTDAQVTALMNVAKLRVPATGVDVALSGGQAAYVNGSEKGTVMLGSIIGKFTTTDGYDVMVNMTKTTDKNVVTNHIAAFHVKDNSLLFTSAITVGSGVMVKSLDAKPDPAATSATAPRIFNSATGYELTVSYLERKPQDPAGAAPSVSKTFEARVKNHVLSRQ